MATVIVGHHHIGKLTEFFIQKQFQIILCYAHLSLCHSYVASKSSKNALPAGAVELLITLAVTMPELVGVKFKDSCSQLPAPTVIVAVAFDTPHSVPFKT